MSEIGARFFLVDPLDGTKEFISRNGEFTVNIAEIENGRPVRGVVYLPAKDRLFIGEAGHGAFEVDDVAGKRRIFQRQSGLQRAAGAGGRTGCGRQPQPSRLPHRRIP